MEVYEPLPVYPAAALDAGNIYSKNTRFIHLKHFHIPHYVKRIPLTTMDYEQWNQAIISCFFEECEPGEIVFLQTNAEMLSEIARLSGFNVEDAAESLKVAVRNKVVAGDRVNLKPIYPADLGDLWWSIPEKEPPQVAFLALTVLAASLMGPEGSVSSQNYYTRLNEILLRKIIKGKPPGFDPRQSQFEELWKHLQRWARDQHDVELYLTKGPRSRKYVWYPISQSLISKHDLPTIYRFFTSNKLHPFSKISDDQLLNKFRYWYDFGTLSVRIRHRVDNEHYAQLVGSQVQLLLKSWDGHEIPPAPPNTRTSISRPSRIDVELRFNLSGNVEIRYWFPRRGRNEINCKINSFGIRCLQTSDSEKWFRPVIDKEGTFWGLLNSLQLQTDEIKPVIYTLGCSNIWVFRKDPERDDGWLSQRNMQLYEDHLIVFRKWLVNQVIAYVEQTCELEADTLSPIYDDWLCLRGTPTKPLPVSNSELWRLSVDSDKRIRFIGGLSVRDQNGHRAYLNICLPTVFVPDLGLPSGVPLKVGSQELSVGKDRLVMLEGILGSEVHKISYGGKTSDLRVITPKRSLEHNNRTLAAALPQDGPEMPTYSMRRIAEIRAKSGVWLAGARFLGTDIPEITWEEVQTEPQVQEEDNKSFFKVPAELISLIVKTAIELKQDKASVPEWLGQAIEYLDQNVALRSLVQKKLEHYHETALSYTDLREEGGSHGSETISRRKTERLNKKE